MRTRSIVAAAAIVAVGASSAAAQTADDIAGLFPAIGWTAQTVENPLIGCIAAFGGDESPRGYDIRLDNGTRHGELRFNWQGTDHVVAYEIEFRDGGTRANRVSLRWDGRSRSLGGSLSLAEAIQRADDPRAAAVLEYVWSADFCAPAVELAGLFPPNRWTIVNVAAPLNDVFTCVATFGPTEDDREGHHFATADGAFGGTLTFFGDANDRWTLAYRRESDAEGGRVSASVRGGGANFATMDVTMNITLPISPFPGAGFSEDARPGTAIAFMRYLLEELVTYLETTTFCP